MEFLGSVLDFFFGWIPTPDILPSVPGYVELPLAVIVVIAVIVVAIKAFAEVAGKVLLAAAAIAVLLFVFTDDPVGVAGKGINGARDVASDFVGIVRGSEEPGAESGAGDEGARDPDGGEPVAADSRGSGEAGEPGAGGDDSDSSTESDDGPTAAESAESVEGLFQDVLPDIGGSGEGDSQGSGE